MGGAGSPVSKSVRPEARNDVRLDAPVASNHPGPVVPAL
jgi:hypothetical protein